MDSVTQATLGAVLGECLLARRLGNRAAAWGAVIGTLPDLDVLVFPWLDSVQRLSWHRGLSHSVLGIAVAAPLLVWLLRRVHRERLASARGAVWAFVTLNLVTHVLIDCFNVYGTQVLEPFSRWRCAFGNLFIVDPAFTLPMLLATLTAMLVHRESRRRRVVAWTGLGLSTVYAALSFALQAHADARFAAAIERAGLPALRRQVASGPLTALYQRCLVDCG
ncbi:MAG: metal-dependent hydrolase, partial [Planctomycetota bacterium]